jgi:hypothetical protein
MKRLIIPMIAALAMVATSCSSEEAEMTNSGEECVVTVSASLPMEMGTRSFSDGLTAEKLQYAIYDADGKYISEGATTFDGGLTASVQLRLAVGKTFNIAFWASAVSSPYTFNTDEHKVTVNYTDATCNDESRDAFFYALNNLKVEGSLDKNITLTRPFAQINFGTSDKSDANKSGLKVQMSKVTVSSVYDTLDLLDGTVSGEEKDVTFGFASVPTTENFPVEKYDYLAMNYILVPAVKSVVDATLAIADNNGNQNFEHTYTSLPVQGNYRTNVYGALFTAPADFTVTKDKGYTDSYKAEYVLVESQEDFEEQTAIENNKVQIPENTSVTLGKVADGVSIAGSGVNSVIYCDGDNPVDANDFTISDASIKDSSLKSSSRKKVAAQGATVDGASLVLNGDNAKLENCDIYSNTMSVYVAAGKKATINNCTFKPGRIGFKGVVLNTDSELEMNNCTYQRNYGGSYCIYSNGKCSVKATNTVFSGWMSGWHNGAEFENCTFQYGYYWYPDAICYGNTVFNSCKFEYVGSSYLNDGDKSVYGNYGFNYVVSGRGPKIEFNNCTYTSTIDGYEGKAVDSYIYHPGQGDDKTDAKEVYIDGKLVYSQETGRIVE